MIRTKMLRWVLVAMVCAGVSVRGNGQTAVDGAIGGTVEDASGAVVPGAVVVVHSNGTNAEQTLKADDAGFFRAIHLQPGVYTVTVTAAGYETYKATAVTVQVGSLSDPQARLKVGAASETVEVTSEGPAINTTSPDFANTIDQTVLKDLPVANYRWSSYALLTPGVVTDANGFGLLSFRGQSTLLNNVTFDGADDNQAYFSEERGRTRVGYSTAKASIQEFQVNTSNYSVEYGRSAGGVVNAVTKSGTNALHGEMYFYDRDAGWGAKNPFTTRAVQTSTNPVAFTSEVFKPKDWRKQMGIGIGGPIIKDKLFFFFAFDDFKRNFPGISAPSNPVLFYTLPDATLPAGTCATVSATSIDGAACQLAANLNHLLPVGTTSNASLVTSAQYAAAAQKYIAGISALSGITGTTPRTGDQNIFFPKVDWQINGRNHATVELNRLRWTSPAGIQTGTSAVNFGIASFGNDYVKATFLIAKLDTAITSKLSNEVRYQYGRDFEYENNQTPTSYEQSTLLTPSGYTNPYGIAPNVFITNAFQFGTPLFLNRPAFPDERRWQISDTANLVRGNHNLKFGVDYLHTYDLIQNLFAQYGGYSYGGSNYTPYVEYLTDLNTLNGCAPLVNKVAAPQECYTNYQQSFGKPGFDLTTGDYAFFVQDEWKFNPRLSLTLGVRYEYEQLPSAQVPNAALDAQVINGNQIHGSTSHLPSNKGNIGPRVGFAWDIFGTGKTVVRGGYGEFFARIINSTIYNAISQTGLATGQQSISVTNSTQSPNVMFPQIVNPANAANAVAGASSVAYFDSNFKAPEIQQADLTVEQDLGRSTTMSVSWLGAYGRRLPDFVDTNLPAATGTISYKVVDSTGKGPLGNGTLVTVPFYGKLPSGVSKNGRPNPGYGAMTDIFSGVNSNYEALVAQVSHRFTRGLQFNANYTWSHALDFGENNQTGTAANALLDPANLRLDYGNSNQNVPSRLVAYAVYQTPSPFHGLLGYLLNEYEVAPSFAIQSGLPYSVNVTGSTSGLTAVGTTGAAIATSINGSGGANRIPTLDRNLLQQPRTVNLDMRLSKRFNVTEKAKVELLGESFNVANHLNVTGVTNNAYGYAAGTGVNAGTNLLTYNTQFGVRSSGNSTLNYSPRQIQLGVKVEF